MFNAYLTENPNNDSYPTWGRHRWTATILQNDVEQLARDDDCHYVNTDEHRHQARLDHAPHIVENMRFVNPCSSLQSDLGSL